MAKLKESDIQDPRDHRCMTLVLAKLPYYITAEAMRGSVIYRMIMYVLDVNTLLNWYQKFGFAFCTHFQKTPVCPIYIFQQN